MKKPRARWEHQHEPSPEGDEWVECGGQRIWAAGFTNWDFPYGITEDELRTANVRLSPDAGWARAKRILETTIRAREHNAAVDIGYVRKIGQGLSRDIFFAEVEITTTSRRDVSEIAVLLPRRGCDPNIDERTLKEARLLGDLGAMSLPFRVPRVFDIYPDDEHLVLVRSFERGVELDLRAGRQTRVRPWETVATIAAAIHKVRAAGIPWLAPRYLTRREHAQAAIHVLDHVCAPEAVDARAWAEEHLPPATPSTLVHGDLLGQNILLGLSEPNVVIDWEYAQFGDPAYDLAIVTRGVRRPFQIDRGLDRLLDAYAQAGGADVTQAHVHLHELVLAAHWYSDSLHGESRHAPQQALQTLRSVLRRASTRSS